MNRIGWVVQPEMTQPKRPEFALLLKVRTGSLSAPRAGVVPASPPRPFLHRLGAKSDGFSPGLALSLRHLHSIPEIIMGKYLLGWVLGVPAIVLVIAYFFFN